jgi:cobalt-zinc-cadmium efflux system outer membrane protein
VLTHPVATIARNACPPRVTSYFNVLIFAFVEEAIRIYGGPSVSTESSSGDRVSHPRLATGRDVGAPSAWVRRSAVSACAWYRRCFGAGPMSVRWALITVLSAAALNICSERSAGAQQQTVPASTELPQLLTLDEALHIFRTRGLEILIADANVKNAEGAIHIAGAVPNPVISASVGNSITYSTTNYSYQNCLTNGAVCSPWTNTIGLTDSAALEDTISGKRDLRLKVARNALAAAKLSRVDAERTLAFQVQSAYLQVAQAVLGYKFAKDVADANVTLLEKVHVWLSQGKSGITDADVARMETQKSESDQALDSALQTLRQARVALAFLVGVRGEVPDFDVDTHVLDYRLPSGLQSATEVGLLRTAFSRRPDLLAAGYNVYSAEAALALVKRQKFPDITAGVSFGFGGFGGLSTNGPIGPQLVTFSLSAPIPVFYALQGEQKQAEAALDTNSLTQAVAAKQVVNDVDNGYAGFIAARNLVLRMEKGEPEGAVRPILQSAKVALDITRLQWERGAASLTDFLLALQTYIATKVEYYGDLTNYWTAVYQLEEAVATELHQ